jgi:rare lipoprotein A
MMSTSTRRAKVSRLLCVIAAALLLSACTKPTGGVYKVGKPYRVADQWYYPKVDYAYHERGLASWYGPNFHGRPTANGETFDMRKVSAAHKTLPLPSVVRVTNLENGRSLVVRVNDRGPFIRGRIIDLSQKAAELLGFVEQGTALVDVQLIVEPSRQAALKVGAARNPDFGPPPPKAAPSIEVTIENLNPKGNTVAAGGSGGASASRPVRVASTEPAVPGTPPPYDGMTNIGTGTNAADAVVDVVPVGDAPPIFVQAGAFAQYDNANRLRARIGLLGYPVRVHQVYITNQPMFRVRVGPLRSVEAADQALDRLVAAGYADAQIVID